MTRFETPCYLSTMRAIITRRNGMGKFPEVGTSGRHVTGEYASRRTLDRHVRSLGRGTYRVEILDPVNPYKEPVQTYIIEVEP